MKLKNNLKGNRYFKYEHSFGSFFFFNVVVSEMDDQRKMELKWELRGASHALETAEHSTVEGGRRPESEHVVASLECY